MSEQAVQEATIPLIAVVGPTASGKTGLGIALAEALGGEIISADSRQIYHEMEIGTAKPTAAERARVRHHLLDVVAPDESYTLALYQRDAEAAIREIWSRGKRPILVGGTGLYLRSITDGLDIPAVEPQTELRAEWEALAAREGPAAVHALLAAHDPVAAANIDSANIRRVIRALEVCIVTGEPFSAQRRVRPTPYRLTMIGLNSDRTLLYTWADQRVDAMLALGFVAEVRHLVERGYAWTLPAMSSLGYKQVGTYLRGEMPLADAVQRLKFDTHGFIRKQLIWFRPDTRITWLDPTSSHLVNDALAVIAKSDTALLLLA